MDLPLALAASLCVVLAIAHSALGERYILTRLFRRPLPPLFGDDTFTRRTLRFAWHLTSVLWLGAAATLWLVRDATTLRILSITFAACAAATLVGARGRHHAWWVMAAIAALAWR